MYIYEKIFLVLEFVVNDIYRWKNSVFYIFSDKDWSNVKDWQFYSYIPVIILFDVGQLIHTNHPYYEGKSYFIFYHIYNDRNIIL